MILEILMFTVRMALFYCLIIYFKYFFVIIVFCICFSSCILSLLSYACAGTQLGDAFCAETITKFATNVTLTTKHTQCYNYYFRIIFSGLADMAQKDVPCSIFDV